MPDLQIRRLSHALGAEIIGVDISKPLKTDIVRALTDAWHQHLILLFRNQELTPEQHIAFTRHFGNVDSNDDSPSFRMPDYPNIMELTNRHADGKPAASGEVGRRWHSDLEHTLRPSKGSLLWCGEAPDVGGDTMFANMYLAYEALSDGMRLILDRLFAEHDVAQVLHDYDRRTPALAAEFKKISPPVGHPVVRVHPDTNRKSLFVSDRVRRFIGMSDEESAPLLRFLCDFSTRPQFVYRHQWRARDLVMWDNRCTMHLALGDYDRSQRRYMRRTGLQGEPSGYLVNLPAAAG